MAREPRRPTGAWVAARRVPTAAPLLATAAAAGLALALPLLAAFSGPGADPDPDAGSRLPAPGEDYPAVRPIGGTE